MRQVQQNAWPRPSDVFLFGWAAFFRPGLHWKGALRTLIEQSPGSAVCEPPRAFQKRGAAANLHPMFCIFHGLMLIGRSKLESGDPPMGVASGLFEPTADFELLRNTMRPARDGTGQEQRDIRFLASLRAEAADGVQLVCTGVEVFEYGEADNPWAWEVFCLGIEQPPYHELFPHHVRAYEDQFEV